MKSRSNLNLNLNIDRTMLAFCILATTTPAFAQRFTGLGGFQSAALSISEDGSTAAGYTRSGQFLDAAMWQGQSNPSRPPGIAQQADSEITGVSGDGAVLVGTSGAFGSGAGYRAFRWTLQDGAVDLGVLPGCDSATAESISQDGGVIVGMSFVAGRRWQAYRWAPTTGMVGLGNVPGAVSSHAFGVSSDGRVVVGLSAALSAWPDAFRWTPETGMVNIGRLPGMVATVAYATNDDGSVVVGVSAGSDYRNGQAFRWTPSTGMVSLGGLPGSTDSRAVDVNGDASVVVGYSTRGDTLARATVWRKTTGALELAEVLSGSGVDLAGWHLAYAYGVSADGRTIVGSGEHDGNFEAWMATLPPYCLADFNGLNGRSIQDLFDFLSAFFSNSPRADVDGVDGVGVADLFAFLAAYLMGCA